MNCHRLNYLNPKKSELEPQIQEAKEKLRLARQEEMYADETHLEIAMEKVRIALANLNLLYKQAKLY